MITTTSRPLSRSDRRGGQWPGLASEDPDAGLLAAPCAFCSVRDRDAGFALRLTLT